MRKMDKWTSREYEPMRRKLIEHGILIDELEAMAAAVCEDAGAICYYTEADY